jgi:hypothetical protein
VVEKNIPAFFIFMLQVLDEVQGEYSVLFRSLLKFLPILLVAYIAFHSSSFLREALLMAFDALNAIHKTETKSEAGKI